MKYLVSEMAIKAVIVEVSTEEEVALLRATSGGGRKCYDKGFVIDIYEAIKGLKKKRNFPRPAALKPLPHNEPELINTLIKQLQELDKETFTHVIIE